MTETHLSEEKQTPCSVKLPTRSRSGNLQIDRIVWLSQFVEKLVSKHNVTTMEVEEIFANRPRFRFVTRGNRSGEDVYSVMGRTDAGRYLIVFFILKPHHRALVVSARDMDRKERREYARKR